MTDRIRWGEPVTGLDGVIAVAQALKDGKPVQERQYGEWREFAPDEHIYSGDKYRIGEEVKPREFWVNVYHGERGTSVAYASRELADAGAGFNRSGCIHVREVIE